MEPPGGVPPDRGDRQLVLRTQHQQPLVPVQQQQQHHQQQQQQPPQHHQLKPSTLTLNLPHTPQAFATIATSPATAALIAASANASGAGSGRVSGAGGSSSSGNNTITASTSTSPALASTATQFSAATQAATAFSGSSIGQSHRHSHHHHHHHSHHTHHQQQLPQSQHQTHLQHVTHYHPPLQQNSSSASSSLLGGISTASSTSGSQQQTIEKLSRPMAFDKMESLVREMQHPEHGVPVRQQKMFLTSIPYAFMGYDLIEWLMDRLLIEESEALNIANQLCLHGYFFPVNDTKTLTVKDDSSLYRFQTPYYWPWQHKAPDNVEYAIYLAKRSLRNKQRHALEDYEAEALASLHKNLKGKWDFISMQAEEQVRLAKERKKGDKIVGDSQERAYWRVHRPPPGQFTPLEPCPIPSRDRQGAKPNKKKTLEDVQREVDYLKKSLNRTRMKMSQACESLVGYSETFAEYDFFLQPVLPSNPWVTEDITFWQLNNTFVDIPTEKRVRRWAISIEELVCDPTGLQEFTSFLEKEYSHENIRFWIAVNRLRRSAHSQVARKVNEIYEEFLKPGAPCEINIDGKTMESVLKGLKSPSRFTFDSASEHIYMLLLKKDCYPRFIRSDHYKRLVETGIQPSHKKRFFNFGGVGGAKKKMTAALSSQPNLGDMATSSKGGNVSSSMMPAPPPGSLARRRGSDRSLTGSAHELAVIGVNKDMSSKVPHSHSQSNLSEIPYSNETVYRGDMPSSQRHNQMMVMDAGICATYGMQESCLHTKQETPKPKAARLETTIESSSSAVCPWDMPDEPPVIQAPAPVKAQVKLSICPWEQDNGTSPALATTAAMAKIGSQRLTSTSSDITSDASDRTQRNLGIRHQNTVDSGEAGIKRLIPNFTEQRRASVSFTPGRNTDYQLGRQSNVQASATPSPTVSSQCVVDNPNFPPLFTPFLAQTVAATVANTANVITKDPPSSSDAEIEEELNKLSVSERNSESSASEMSILPPPTPTPPPLTKITPPPPEVTVAAETPTSEEPTPQQSHESPRSESVISGGGEMDDGAIECETEVEALVQEVQIELIEATEFEDESGRTQNLLEVATLTIQTQDQSITAVGSLVKSPSLRSPKEVVGEVMEATGNEAQCDDTTPTMHRSPTTQTPEPTALEQAAATFNVAAISALLPREIPSSSPSSPSNAPLPTSSLPPPVPEIGPMEEEEQLKGLQLEEEEVAQEELSPTTDEYQEGLQFGGDSKEDYDYDLADGEESQLGYIPPAPTPAPSMAPLAELDVDTVDDESCDDVKMATTTTEVNLTAQQTVVVPPLSSADVHATPACTTEEVKKRRKKRNSDGKKMASLEDKASTSAEVGGGGAVKAEQQTEADRNTVCPWEDENVSTSDGTFVKTYATLGYL